jgi:predicted TIM-barrel fold metal-dependent hydrolase
MRTDAHHHPWRYENEALGWIVPGSVIARDFATEQLRPALNGAGLTGSAQ